MESSSQEYVSVSYLQGAGDHTAESLEEAGTPTAAFGNRKRLDSYWTLHIFWMSPSCAKDDFIDGLLLLSSCWLRPCSDKQTKLSSHFDTVLWATWLWNHLLVQNLTKQKTRAIDFADCWLLYLLPNTCLPNAVTIIFEVCTLFLVRQLCCSELLTPYCRSNLLCTAPDLPGMHDWSISLLKPPNPISNLPMVVFLQAGF